MLEVVFVEFHIAEKYILIFYIYMRYALRVICKYVCRCRD